MTKIYIMDANTKKILLYSGGAILIGSIAFFVHSFFKKEKFVVGNTSISLDEGIKDETSSPTVTKFIPKKDFSTGIDFQATPLMELWDNYK